jgi:hypothetical protein
MNTRVTAAVAALTFVFGVAVGLGGTTRTAVLSTLVRRVQTPTDATPATGSSTLHGLLAILISKNKNFILTGIDDLQGRCNAVVTATGLYGDYMSLKTADGPEFFVPYAAIFKVDREGPGPVTIPVVYSTAHPTAKFCGD